jgi:hypothetical protein
MTLTNEDLTARLSGLLEVRETRYIVLVTDERQQRVFDAREVSLSEMIAILDANGLLKGRSADSLSVPVASASVEDQAVDRGV